MCRSLIPDHVFPQYAAITPAFLQEQGIRALLLDIDNTLAPYEVAVPDEALCAWFAALRSAGIRLALVSNNHADRVEQFNAALALPAYPRAHKPFGRAMRRAMQALGAAPGETAVLGDQLFTDVWAARVRGLRAITVPPIRDKRDPLTRCKRWLERPLYRAYDRRQARLSKERK